MMLGGEGLRPSYVGRSANKNWHIRSGKKTGTVYIQDGGGNIQFLGGTGVHASYAGWGKTKELAHPIREKDRNCVHSGWRWQHSVLGWHWRACIVCRLGQDERIGTSDQGKRQELCTFRMAVATFSS